MHGDDKEHYLIVCFHHNDFKRACEIIQGDLLFVCNAQLISTELLMVKNGAALMKLLKLHSAMMDDKSRKKKLGGKLKN